MDKIFLVKVGQKLEKMCIRYMTEHALKQGSEKNPAYNIEQWFPNTSHWTGYIKFLYKALSKYKHPDLTGRSINSVGVG